MERLLLFLKKVMKYGASKVKANKFKVGSLAILVVLIAKALSRGGGGAEKKEMKIMM